MDGPVTPGGSWVAAVTALGGDGSTATRSARDLERRYAEPHRRYHNGHHVRAVLEDCAWLAHRLRLGAEDRALLTLAACAHDVVYDARPGEDERASAEWATAALAAAGVAADVRQRVADLVLATLTHDAASEDLVAAVLLDADLAILAAGPGAYAGYVAGVRAEFNAVPDDLWAARRARLLRSFVDRPRLFRCAPAVARWEAAARGNVSRELRGLLQ